MGAAFMGGGLGDFVQMAKLMRALRRLRTP
jgi:hypothetical protein